MNRFNILLTTVTRIASYSDPKKLRKIAEKEYGLTPGEALEAAYENVLFEARKCLSEIRAVRQEVSSGSRGRT